MILGILFIASEGVKNHTCSLGWWCQRNNNCEYKSCGKYVLGLSEYGDGIDCNLDITNYNIFS